MVRFMVVYLCHNGLSWPLNDYHHCHIARVSVVERRCTWGSLMNVSSDGVLLSHFYHYLIIVPYIHEIFCHSNSLPCLLCFSLAFLRSNLILPVSIHGHLGDAAIRPLHKCILLLKSLEGFLRWTHLFWTPPKGGNHFFGGSVDMMMGQETGHSWANVAWWENRFSSLRGLFFKGDNHKRFQ